MAENIAELSSTNGQPEVEIVIGQINRGDFDIVLYDSKGLNPLVIGRGGNNDAVAHRYSIGRSFQELDGSTLIWDVIIGASTEDENQNWSVTLIVTQRGNVVTGGQITDQGVFSDIDQMSNELRFTVK